MSRYYTQESIIGITTSDGDVLYHNEKALKGRFDVIKNIIGDCAGEESTPVDVSTKALELILAYTDIFEVPDNNDDWVLLLETADFLNLNNVYNSKLLDQATDYLKEKKVNVLCTLTLHGIISKLENPNHLTPEEEEIVEREKREKEKRTCTHPRWEGPIGLEGPVGELGPRGAIGPSGAGSFY